MGQELPRPLLQCVSLADVFTNPSPPPVYIWDGVTPCGEVTAFGAHGGTGKSFIALMLAVAAAMGLPLFGRPTLKCRVLFVSLEDTTGTIRHRLAKICEAWCIDPAELDGQLQIVDGTDNPELFAVLQYADGGPTPTFTELEELATGFAPKLVIVDNASDAFGGNENDRREVRAFMRRILGRLAKRLQAAVVLLVHVNKALATGGKGTSNSEGYSGSTAWHNSARSRLFMERLGNGSIVIEHQKNNLGPKQPPLSLTWPEGAPFPDVIGTAAHAPFLKWKQQQAEERSAHVMRVILRELADLAKLDQYASPSPTARTNLNKTLEVAAAYKELELGTTDAKTYSIELQKLGYLKAVKYRHDSKDRERLELTPKGFEFAGIEPPTPPTPRPHDEGEADKEWAEGPPSGPPTP